MPKQVRWKPKSEQLRMISTSEKPRSMSESPNGVFVVIGPFKDFGDKPELRAALEMVVRGWNVECKK